MMQAVSRIGKTLFSSRPGAIFSQLAAKNSINAVQSTSVRQKGTWTFSSDDQIKQDIAKTETPVPFDKLYSEHATLHTFFHKESSTWQYVLSSLKEKKAAIFDLALDLDGTTGKLRTSTADGLLKYIDQQGWTLEQIFETHVHADHATAALYAQYAWKVMHPDAKPVRIGIGNTVGLVQNRISQVYGIDGANTDLFDDLFADNEEFKMADIPIRVMHVPGHTPDHIAYYVDNAFVIVGDTMFQPDLGTARADFPGGSADQLYDSSRRLLSLPDETIVCVGHDYPGDAREKQYKATVAEHRKNNKHVHDGVTKEEYVKMRNERDKLLSQPKLLHASMQVNGLAGDLPIIGRNGRKGFMTPLKN